MAADVDRGLRRSERASKPAKRRSDLVDLPDTDEEGSKGGHTPDEGLPVCMLMPPHAQISRVVRIPLTMDDLWG